MKDISFTDYLEHAERIHATEGQIVDSAQERNARAIGRPELDSDANGFGNFEGAGA